MRHPHQQVFSTGDWWDIEEVSPGKFTRVYMRADPHYFHPQDAAPSVCAKCGGGPHGLVTTTTPMAPDLVPGEYMTTPLVVTTPEQRAVLDEFARMLKSATADGGRKRAAGAKPPWWRDPAHEPAIFSHLNHWMHGEQVDHDSGAHPLVHLAWRCLAIAYQETKGQVDPLTGPGRDDVAA